MHAPAPKPPELRICTGDALHWLKQMRDNSVDCAIVDPPYGQTSLLWDQVVPGWAAAVRRVLKPTGSMWVFGTLRHFMEHGTDFKGFKLSHDIIWEKHNGAGFFNDRFRTVHELVAHFYRDDSKWSEVFKCPQFSNDATARTVRRKQRSAHWTGARGPSNYVSEDGGPRLMRSVIYARSEHGRALHPTQKPEDLVELLLRYSCPPHGIVLDPFGGAGTTAVVAKALNRHCILIELNPAYVAIARKRLQL
jgi:site-specific DNA-methyltransferase (adenine-specific)